MKNAT
ncbi:hypothetical protein D041_0433A, partial [Vibrio parahaemolyticus EKP-008]